MKICLEMSSQELLQGTASGTLVDLIKAISVVDDTGKEVITMKAALNETKKDYIESGRLEAPPEKEQSAEDPKPAEEKKPAPAPAPAKKAGITVKDLQEEAVQLLDQGTGTEKLGELLKKYEVKAVPELRPEQYEAFASELKALREAALKEQKEKTMKGAGK